MDVLRHTLTNLKFCTHARTHTPSYIHCSHEIFDPDLTLFSCNEWGAKVRRIKLSDLFRNAELKPIPVCTRLLGRYAIETYVTSILKEKGKGMRS